MRQQDWTDRLRDRLADHEAAVPEGLWADIEQSLPRQQTVGTPLWHRLVSTAAILIWAVGMSWWLWPKGDPRPLTARKGTDSPQHQPATRQPDVALVALTETRPAFPTPQRHAGVSEESTEEPAAPTTATTETEETTEAGEVAQVTPPSAQQTQTTTLQQRQQPATTVATATKQRHTITVGLYANSRLLPTSLDMEGDFLPVEDYIDSPTPNQPPTDSFIPSESIDHEDHHDHPVTIGLTVGIPLNGRWTVETGIVYTRLHSKLTTIANHSKTTTDQTLHYLGIPLNLQYQILEGKRWKAYAGAGTEVDRNLHTGADAKDRLQWSAGGAVGAEYDIVPQLSLYIEPGFRYYFNNHSPVRNFFKEQPLNWSLQMGIRLNLGHQ